MNDLNQWFGSDLSGSATGDLLPVEGITKGQQRILRRLLTNPGDYIFNPGYGAGIPAHVGDVLDVPKITALIRGQILLESCVARTPTPVITVTKITGGITVYILYTDSGTKTPTTLSFDVNK